MAIILPIGGGKGGSGKSFLSGSLAVLLAREGFRTLVIDVDLGAANLHTIIGVTHPRLSLSDFINKRVSNLADTIIATPTPLLFMISGAMNNLDIANLAHEQKMKVLRHIVKLPYDYILLDLGAGTSFNTLDFFMISDHGIFVTTPGTHGHREYLSPHQIRLFPEDSKSFGHPSFSETGPRSRGEKSHGQGH